MKRHYVLNSKCFQWSDGLSGNNTYWTYLTTYLDSRAYGIQLSCDMLNLKEYVIWKRGKLQKYLPINRALLNFKISQQVPTLNRVLFRPTYKRGKWWFFIFIVQSIILIVLTWNTKAIQTRPVMDRFHDSSKHLTMF